MHPQQAFETAYSPPKLYQVTLKGSTGRAGLSFVEGILTADGMTGNRLVFREVELYVAGWFDDPFRTRYVEQFWRSQSVALVKVDTRASAGEGDPGRGSEQRWRYSIPSRRDVLHLSSNSIGSGTDISDHMKDGPEARQDNRLRFNVGG